MPLQSLWQRFQRYYLRYDDLGFSIDISRMRFPEGFFEAMKPKIGEAFTAMQQLEKGAIANPDENRMVGHYWLRDVCGYAVSTMDVSRIARLTLSELSLRTPTRTAYALGTIGVEVISRALGYLDFRTGKNHHIWKISETTKSVITDELRSEYDLGAATQHDVVPERQVANT